MQKYYAYLDGDSIGDAIGNLLNSGNPGRAKLFSESIKESMREIELLISSNRDISILILGGDDVLIEYWSDSTNFLAIPKQIITIFEQSSGLSMSCGIGKSVQEAKFYLALAKTTGKNKIEINKSDMELLRDRQYHTLYVFATSDRPDVYINAIVYCLENEDFSIKRIILSGISRDKVNKDKYELKLRLIKERILLQIDALQGGHYIPRFPRPDDFTDESKIREFNDQGRAEIRDSAKFIGLSTAAQRMYRKVSTLPEIDTKLLDYEKLDEYLSITRTNGFVFDLSGLVKSYMLEVYFLLSQKGSVDIYSFEIKRDERLYDETELIHNLDANNGDYEYQKLSSSKYVEGKVILSEETALKRHKKIKDYETIKIKYAEDFANTWIFILFILSFSLFLACILIVYRGGWSGLEPWTFLALPFLGYILSIIFVLLFKRDFTIKPKVLFDFLKQKKLDQITRDFS